MSGKRFRYALEAVLRQSEWRVDELRRALVEHNAQVQSQEAVLRVLGERSQAALEEWRAQCGDGQLLQPARSAMYGAYLDHLGRESAREQDALVALCAVRDDLIDSLAGATRERDAVQRHKDERLRAFRRERDCAEGKQADDQWIILQHRSINANPT